MNAGDLNQRVTIESRSANLDALGQGVETWSTLATVWAQAQPIRGRELFAAGVENSEASVRFRIRYLATVTGAMRIDWRGVKHAIVAEPIDVDGAKDVLELYCSAGIRDSR